MAGQTHDPTGVVSCCLQLSSVVCLYTSLLLREETWGVSTAAAHIPPFFAFFFLLSFLVEPSFLEVKGFDR